MLVLQPGMELLSLEWKQILNQWTTKEVQAFLWLRCVGAALSLWCTGPSWQWLLLLGSTGSRVCGFRSCGTRALQLLLPGSGAQAQQLGCTGFVGAPLVAQMVKNLPAMREAWA